MLYTYDQRFDVIENLENFYELNKAMQVGFFFVATSYLSCGLSVFEQPADKITKPKSKGLSTPVSL